MYCLNRCCAVLILALAAIVLNLEARAADEIRIAIDAEFGIPGSTSAQAVSQGAQVAVDEINAAGGVLGRRLAIIERDNRAVPARSLNNLRELAQDQQVVAVMCGRYSPVVVELLPEIHRLRMPLLDPWAAADPIVDNGYVPNYVFRLSLRDSWALQVMLRHALSRGARQVGILLPNTEWGRSSLKAAENVFKKEGAPRIVDAQWYNWGDTGTSMLERYQALRQAGAQALIFVANDREAAILVKEMARLAKGERLPVIAHWGLTGGQFFASAGPALRAVDLSVVQTYSFIDQSDPLTRRVLAGLKGVTGNDDPRQVVSPVGVAHAYDLVHLLARAIRQARSSDRQAVREALENLGPYDGLLGHFARPFTAKRHEALTSSDVFMARYADDGAIEPLARTRRERAR